MASITFLLQSRRNPAVIYIRLREGRSLDLKARTKFSIDPENWSTAKGQPKSLKSVPMKLLNEQLQMLSTELLNHYNKCVTDEPINAEWMKNFLHPEKGEEEIPSGLLAYFEYYGRHKRTSIKPSTLKKLNVNKHLLERFEKWSKKKYLIRDVNSDFKLKFEEFCKFCILLYDSLFV
jgi:hypothetical protein